MAVTVGLVGSGPAVEAVRAAIADVNVDVTRVKPGQISQFDLAVVAGVAGDDGFRAANQAAVDGETPWIAVEVGGVGGHAVSTVDAAVSGFTPTVGCYECLRIRAASNLDEEADKPRAGRSDVRLAGALAGREAATVLSGGDTSLFGGVVELPYAERAFLPVPNCPVCGDERDRRLTRDHVDATLDDALARAERALDERVGVIQSVGELSSFPAPYYLATNSETTAFSDASAATHAAGVAADWNTAFMKALGEALERYCAGVYRQSEFTVAASPSNAVPPDAFVRPDQEIDADAPIPWVDAQDLVTDESVSVPAEFVHFPPPQQTYRPSITTGLGLGSSPVEAMLSGLYEVIERDATMLAWYSTFEPMRLDVDDEGFTTLVKRARAENLSITPLLVTQDVDVPVVAVAVHRDEGWPRFAVGSDADLDPDAAARSALAEALQNWMELDRMGRDAAAEESGAIGQYADFPDEARTFVDVTGSIPSVRVGPSNVEDATAELETVVEQVAGVGMDAYATRLTTRDVEQIGFEAVRVLVPQAQPLFTGDAYFGERAETVPQTLGFEPRLEGAFHPYP